MTLLPLTIHAANSKSDNMSERLTAETAEYARNMQVKPFKTVGISGYSGLQRQDSCQTPLIFRGIFRITKLLGTFYIPKEYAEYRVYAKVWAGSIREFGLVNVVNLVHEVIAECLLNDDKVSMNCR